MVEEPCEVEERRRRVEEEERRVNAFLKRPKSGRAPVVFEFIASCEKGLEATEIDQQKGGDWIGWAKQVADRIAPLRNGHLQEAVTDQESAADLE